MCYMICIGLPQLRQQKWLDSLSQRMNFWPARYEGISAAMNGFPVVIIATSMCSCDLFNPRKDDNAEAKYRKKGWSETKIARILQNRNQAEMQSGLAFDFRRWLADAADDCGEAYFFVHWDSYALHYERRVLISSAQLCEPTFVIEEEQLFHVKNA